jgi:hypothetical protein
MIAFVVGKTRQDVIANLPYATPQAGQATPCPPGAPAADAYALLAKFGGADLTGDKPDLAAGTFWSGYRK